jgi:hypothetical protein
LARQIEDPFRELSNKVLASSADADRSKGKKSSSKGKKRGAGDSSDEDEGDHQKKYPKKKAAKQKR